MKVGTVMNWGIQNTTKTHKIKGQNNLTIMLFSNPTKGGITFRIPKWVRFPMLIIMVALALGSLQLVSYITELESRVIVAEGKAQSNAFVIQAQTAMIEDLEATDELRYDQLEAVGSLTAELKAEISDLQAYKKVIDEKLGTSEDEIIIESSDETIPSDTPSKININDGVGGALVTYPAEAIDENVFDLEINRLTEELQKSLGQMSIESTMYEKRDEKVDEMLPYWEAYPSIIPVANTYVTSPYGYRKNPFGGRSYEFHSGVDFKARYQDVWATGSGIVTYAGYNNGYGYMIIIDHGYGLITKYAHNSKLKVEVGDHVERYDVIAKSGNSGRSSGPHLHYEVLLNNETQNPLDYIDKGENDGKK